MARWEPDARGRLEQAALDLYGEHGYDQTTVAEIAQRAGLTERTFFRHFADKREVLFAGSPVLQDLMVVAVLEAPEPTAPIEVVAHALERAGSLIQERRDHARKRYAVIEANAELRERELIKLASLGAALAEALHTRGVPAVAAELTAEAGMAVFRVGFTRWATGPADSDLPTLIRTSLADLRSLTAET